MIARNTSSSRRGFTLIELLVVISIIVILVAVTVPVLSRLSQSNKRTQAANLASAFIANARAMAIQYKRPAAVVFYEQTAYAGSSRNPNQSAVMLALADIDQARYNPAAGIIVFAPLGGQGPQYMPAGIKVAALDEDNVRTVENTNAAKRTRAIVFDASGQLVLRSGLAARWNSAASNGSADKLTFDWSFLLQRTASPWGIDTTTANAPTGASSTPGIIIYDNREYNDAGMNTAAPAARHAWLEKNADILVVNAYTGNLLR